MKVLAAGGRRASGGLPARRAVIRWALRLLRREWRQQLLIVAMLTLAVAAMIIAACVAVNTRGEAAQATFGTGNAIVMLPGADPHLEADIAAVSRQYGPADVIENQTLSTGTSTQATLRAQDPAGPFGRPTLALVSGHYPAGPGQVAFTSQLASLYGVSTGGTWRQGGRDWRVTGIVANPSNLLDEFALVAPGQLARPDQVSLLLRVNSARLTGLPARAQVVTPDDNAFQGGPDPAVVVLLVSVVGLAFIGLIAVAGFTVMAQRRLRALGTISSLGATDGDVRLVMLAGGAMTGAVAAVAGAALGFGAWFGYAPHLQTAVEHVVDPLAVPWQVIIPGMALAVATAVLASWQPARVIAQIPVTAALSGRAPAPTAARWPAAAGAVLLAGSLALLALSGGWAGQGARDTGFLAAGVAAAAIGGYLLCPACLRLLAGTAGRRAPVAARIALRDLARYRARSGAALGAVVLAVFLAMLTCLAASYRFANPLDWTGPNLASDELLIQGVGVPGQSTEPAVVKSQAGQLHAASVLELEGADKPATSVPQRPGLLRRSGKRADVPLPAYWPASLWQQNTTANNFSGDIYVATPALLTRYGIRQSQIEPGADILTMRPGLAAEPQLNLTACPIQLGVTANACPPHSIIRNPVIQTISSLPSGTSEPNTLITIHAVRELGLQVGTAGWLITSPAALTASQISDARAAVTAAGGQIETRSGQLSLAEIGDGASAVGILIALAVLVTSVGLLRSETSGDLRILTAAGASARTRRAITSVTAGALGLLGAVIGTAVACLAVVTWVHGSLSAIFPNVPVTDYLLILIGLPFAATAGGWLFAGREPPAIASQPIG